MIEVKLRTLTPLWTGNVDRDSPSLKETGLLGSMRFWYEAWVRALGGSACDPASKGHKCEYKGEKGSICNACQLFGCTGWARKFRIECTGFESTPLFLVTSSKINQGWLKRIFEKQNNALFGRASLKLTAEDKNNEDVLLATLSMMAKYGGLGAKTQHGFGQFIIENLDTKRVENGLSIIRREISEKTENTHQPSLSKFFVLKFKIDENNGIVDYYLKNPFMIGTPSNKYGTYIPCSFDIRFKGAIRYQNFGLRDHFKTKYGKDAAEGIFGYSRGENKRQGSKIFVSHLFKENDSDKFYFLKIWGFTQPQLSTRNGPIDLRKEITNHIQGKFKPVLLVFDKTGKELKEVSK